MSVEEQAIAPDLDGFLRWLEEYWDGDGDPYRGWLTRLTLISAARGQADPEECAALSLHTAALLYNESVRIAYGHPGKLLSGVVRNMNHKMQRRTQRHVVLDERLAIAQHPRLIDEQFELEFLRQCIEHIGTSRWSEVLVYTRGKQSGDAAAEKRKRTRICRTIAKLRQCVEHRRRISERKK